MLKHIALALTTCILSSCATILTGTQRPVQIDSFPSGAKVEINGLEYGQTPLTVQLKGSSTAPIITVKADGYETKTIVPPSSFNVISILNLGNLIGWGVDIATGAMWTYDVKYYKVELTKSQR